MGTVSENQEHCVCHELLDLSVCCLWMPIVCPQQGLLVIAKLICEKALVNISL